jgi:hypothetical protein
VFFRFFFVQSLAGGSENLGVDAGVSVVGEVMGTIRRGWNFCACDSKAWRFSGEALSDAAEEGVMVASILAFFCSSGCCL